MQITPRRIAAQTYDYARMTLGFARLLHAAAPSDPEERIRRQLESREEVFLDTVHTVVFSDPEHPYHRMFRLAGCTWEDLCQSVRRDGLEATLAALHRNGVYATSDEIKGKKPIIRSGKDVGAGAEGFVNPLVHGVFPTFSSGSRGRSLKTSRSLESQLYRECHEHLLGREYGFDGRVQVSLGPILPGIWGISRCIRATRMGNPIERWFTAGGTFRDAGHYRFVTRAIIGALNGIGARAPQPVYLPPNDFTPVAEWLARRKAEGALCVVSSVVSPAVRVVAAAREKGLDIAGTVFRVAGEAVTDAKRAVFESAGTEVITTYFITEIGLVGSACRQMRCGNSVHLLEDGAAVISYRRTAPLTEFEVDSLLFTTLLPHSPRFLINAEMDDAGIIEEARCDCTFSAIGFHRRIHGIFSYGKLTGQGTTLVGSDIVRILEEALPARFGGGPGDYQLVEGEGASQSQLTLRVSPRVGSVSPSEAREYFLEQVRRLYHGALTCREWRHAGAVEAVIEEPVAGRTGKVLSLHLFGPAQRGASGS